MPRFLQDFIIPALDDGRYEEKLRWVNRDEGVFVVRWRHKGTSTWHEEDTVVFQDWDKLKGHYRPSSSDYLIRSKQRFRAALYKLNNVTELKKVDTNKEVKYRQYQILCTDKKKKKGKKRKTSEEQDQDVPSSPMNSASPSSENDSFVLDSSDVSNSPDVGLKNEHKNLSSCVDLHYNSSLPVGDFSVTSTVSSSVNINSPDLSNPPDGCLKKEHNIPSYVDQYLSCNDILHSFSCESVFCPYSQLNTSDLSVGEFHNELKFASIIEGLEFTEDKNPF